MNFGGFGVEDFGSYLGVMMSLMMSSVTSLMTSSGENGLKMGKIGVSLSFFV